MDSPEPGSAGSRSSSDSPTLDEIALPSVPESSYGFSNVRGEQYSSGGKRRLPVGNIGSSTKNRRREEASTRRPATNTSTWVPADYGAQARPSRDELIDYHVVDKVQAGA